MISDFNELTRLFGEIGNGLGKKVQFYVIGGAMLLYHGMKTATKDIDVIVGKESEYHMAKNALRKLNFTAKAPLFGYEKVDLSQIFVREDFRIDLFHRTVCKGFHLSDGMIRRAQKILELKHLSIFLCSPEDVLLFKTFTEREGDLADCLNIARQKKIDWNTILEEVKDQIKTSGNPVWITWIGERLDLLEDKGLNIPIMKEINALREKYYAELEKRQARK